MKTMAHPAKRCECPQCQGDRWGNRIAWVLIAFTVVFLAAQIARAAHVWPFA